MGSLFGTDGIRGKANEEPLTPSTLARIGQSIGRAMTERDLTKRVILGRDPRRSGPMVGGAIMSGLLAAGIDVTVAGVLPTPAVARLARARRFGLGIVISASHNPAGDNGVKLFAGNARKAGSRFQDEIEAHLRDGADAEGARETGAYRPWPDAGEAYVDTLLADFGDLDLRGLTIAVDCANGAMSEVAPAAFRRLGAKVHAIHASPNGRNINRRCGAMHPRAAARALKAHGADAGVSFDGDGDRAIFADETGRTLDGDACMAILARDLLARRRLPKRTVVATVMSNLGLEISLREIDARLVRTKVGDRHVVAEMDRGGYALGGEQSGHIVVRKGGRLVGDGLESALHLLAARSRAKEPFSRLGRCFSRLPQLLVNVRVRERKPLDKIRSVRDVIREVEDRLGDSGRVVVRYSGTEPLARVMVEGPSPSVTRSVAGRIAAAIEDEIGSA